MLLLVFCAFVIFAFLIGVWQDRKAKWLAKRMTEQHEPLSVARTIARDGNGRGAEPQRAWREESPAAGLARRAA